MGEKLRTKRRKRSHTAGPVLVDLKAGPEPVLDQLYISHDQSSNQNLWFWSSCVDEPLQRSFQSVEPNPAVLDVLKVLTQLDHHDI